MNLFFETFSTPLGDFSVAVTEVGALAGTAFGHESALRSRLGDCHLINNHRLTKDVKQQVLAYFKGERREFDLPLAPDGTAFQQSAWTELRRIPFGETRTYGQLATTLGNPKASRAVGRANATNPICLIVPCHRVIGADGSLTGFAFGEDVKQKLLEHEKKFSRRVTSLKPEVASAA
jgi:methylated-DNA-[protein]-cysteine S-methyltransferase